MIVVHRLNHSRGGLGRQDPKLMAFLERWNAAANKS
jgi:hypothetical protein